MTRLLLVIAAILAWYRRRPPVEEPYMDVVVPWDAPEYEAAVEPWRRAA